MKVLLIYYAYYLVYILFIYRQSGKSRLLEYLSQLFLRAVSLDGLHLRSRRHHVLRSQLIKLDGVLYKLAVPLLDAAAFFRLFHHGENLVSCYGFVVVQLEHLRYELLPHGEYEVHRSQKRHEKFQRRR